MAGTVTKGDADLTSTSDIKNNAGAGQNLAGDPHYHRRSATLSNPNHLLNQPLDDRQLFDAGQHS